MHSKKIIIFPLVRSSLFLVFFLASLFFIYSSADAENRTCQGPDKTVADSQANVRKEFNAVNIEEEGELQEDYDDEFDDDFEEETDSKIFDPLSGYNRFMTGFNDKLYYWAFKPVAQGYSFIIPEPGRLAINRCFRNLMFPMRLVNNLLQLKFKNAGIETLRFGVNTTVGILGFRDPARSYFNLNPCKEDFGQTLGRYGIGGGFHIVLPVFGPSNLRDAIGKIPDYFLNPINYIEDGYAAIGVNAFDRTNYGSLHIGEYEAIQKDALDFYILMRDSYEQNRKMKIKE